MRVPVRMFSLALAILLAWGQIALARHITIHETPDSNACQLCVNHSQSAGGIIPSPFYLEITTDRDFFRQPLARSHISLLPTRPQQARAPPHLA
jgi:hypothetical protein